MKRYTINKLKRFLAELESHGIAYVSWKNNHQLQSALSGKENLDIFVSSEDHSKFISLCHDHGWLEVYNPVSTHSYVSHFYNLGEDLEVFHLHVYFKLITGDSWIKEYLIPFDSWLLENRLWDSSNNIWVLDNSSQAYLFLIRHLLKCGSISGRFLYRRELKSYKKEWKQCSGELNQKDIKGPVDLSKYLSGTNAFNENFRLPNIFTAIRFRVYFSTYLRYRSFTLPFRRWLSFLKRLNNKLRLNQKKLLHKRGIVISISGVDGSGKTSMLEEVNKVFGKFLTINRYHLGRPQGKVIEYIWRALGNRSESSSMPGTRASNDSTSLGKSVNGVILSLLRLRKARQITAQASQGALILTDRWPTNEVGKMDGPRVILGRKSGCLQLLCKRIETWAYTQMPKTDICYFFEVPVEVAIERNRARIKENKETEEMINARFLANFKFQPIAYKTIKFENSGSFMSKRKEFLDSVWLQIINRF